MGIQNSLRFSANEQDTDAMFAKERKSRSKFYAKMSCQMAEPNAPLKEDTEYFNE